MPRLTLVVSSRNDCYQGNSVWRLQTSLNYLAYQAMLAGTTGAMEVIVTDWGSRIPLREALSLTSEAAAITRFLEIPPDLAVELQKDSPFPEVLANNAAIRRASGFYVGRIDQDTLVGRDFLKFFMAPGGQVEHDLRRSVVFGRRRSIPIQFARQCRPLDEVVAYLDALGGWLPQEDRCRIPWYDASVGVLLMPREIWWKSGGYDEGLIYWGYMDTELIERLKETYPVLSLPTSTPSPFYHLRHSSRRLTRTARKKNPRQSLSHAPRAGWGLAGHDLKLRQAEPSHPPVSRRPGEVISLAAGAVVLQESLWEAALVVPRLGYNLLRRVLWAHGAPCHHRPSSR